MSEKQRTYIAIDLKSFYASVECVERGLDPLTTNLVVADASLCSRSRRSSVKMPSSKARVTKRGRRHERGINRQVTFTYFVPDALKKGGSYKSSTGIVQKVDDYTRTLTLEGGERIEIGRIIEIQTD